MCRKLNKQLVFKLKIIQFKVIEPLNQTVTKVKKIFITKEYD